MPRISTFMYSERVETNNQGQMNIANPLLALNPMYIPGMFSFCITFGVIGFDQQMDHSLRILFLSPIEGEDPIIDTKSLPISPGNFPRKEIGLPPEQKGTVFNLDFRNVVFKNEGLYKTQVYFDGDLLGEYPIYARAGENNQ